MIIEILIALFLFFVVIPLAIQLLFQEWFWCLIVAPIALVIYILAIAG